MAKRRFALVTGASGNLGQVVCMHLQAAGQVSLARPFARFDRVVRLERTRALLDGTEIGKVDLGSAAATRELFQRLAHELGGLDAVVHTVGTFRPSEPAESWDGEALRFLFETNVVTSANVLSAALSVMKPAGRGQIVMVASTAALRGAAGVAAYAASKAAELRLVESVAAEVAGTQIGVSAVLPGTMDTPPNRAAEPSADRSRWVTLDEVADVIAYLASPSGLPLSGQAIRVARD